MATLAFTTQPINSGAQYEIIDSSTGYNPLYYPTRGLNIVSAISNNPLFQKADYPNDGTNLVVDTDTWTLLNGGEEGVNVTLSYGGDSVEQQYLLPKSLNTKA